MKTNHKKFNIKLSVVNCAIALALLIYGPFVAAKQVCNKTATQIIFAYAYKEVSTEFNITGWYWIDAGECITLRKSVGGKHYGYGHVNMDDPVANFLGSEGIYSGIAKNNDPLFCTVSNAFHFSESNADQNCKKKLFFEIEAEESQNLIETNYSTDYGIKSLEDAKHVANSIKGQLLYGSDTQNDPKGIPFRVGIEMIQDDVSVYVNKVYAGMPAALILQPGDRLMEINGLPIRSAFDVMFEIDRVGKTFSPSERHGNLVLSFYRWPSLDKDPILYEASLPMVYMNKFDDRQKRKGEALVMSAYDSVLLGFSSSVTCSAVYLFDRLVKDRTHDQAAPGCLNRMKKNIAMLKEQHDEVYSVGDIGGAMFTPRFFLKAFGKHAGKRVASRAAIGFVDESVQGLLTVLGQKTPDQKLTPPQLAQVAAVSGLMGAAIAVVSKN